LITAISLVREHQGGYKAKMTHGQNSLAGRVLVSLVALLWIATSHAAEPGSFASAWSQGLNSALRLVSAGAADGLLQAAIEIRLDPNAITYWRNPGEAGAPPRFSFRGSQNVAATKVSFPAPKRLQEGGTTAFGYENGVVFPLQVTPIDPHKPVVIEATVDYAVCAAICVPARGIARLTLKSEPGPFAALVGRAEARIPRPLRGDSSFQTTAEPGGTSWIVRLPAALPIRQDSDTDLFVEAPEGWYFETRPLPAGQGFRLKLTEKPADASPPIEGIRLTLVSASAAVEAVVRLDGAPPAP
jgi:DsbC/DsbD-like thiol-disulfide interchange protein